jgi:hypothetical protein
MEPLYLLVSDAHKGVLHYGLDANERYEPVEIIDEIAGRLAAAKAAYLSGDRVEASKQFDCRYEVS